MKEIEILKPSSFLAKDHFNIYENGSLFYSDTFTNVLKRYGMIVFNLPSGKYNIEGNIMEIQYKKPKLFRLPLTLYKENINDYEIKIVSRADKAAIDHDNKNVYIDPALLQRPIYVMDLILSHEMGHCYYDSEINADKFAINTMLELGYNPSQIFMAAYEGFTNKQNQRINKILTQLERI